MRKKQFDCVEMKNQIQQDLFEQRKDMTDEDIEEQRIRNIENSDSPISILWKQYYKRTVPN